MRPSLTSPRSNTVRSWIVKAGATAFSRRRNTDGAGIGGPATAASCPAPSGLTVDDQDNVYIACLRAIEKVDHATGIMTTFAGAPPPTVGYFIGHGPGTTPATQKVQLSDSAMAFDKTTGNLYFLGSPNTFYSRVSKRDAATQTVVKSRVLASEGMG
jgi:hypothetical protein